MLGVRVSLDNDESHSVVNLDKPPLFFFFFLKPSFVSSSGNSHRLDSVISSISKIHSIHIQYMRESSR